MSFGKAYVANTDLPERFASGTPLNSLANVQDPSKIRDYFWLDQSPVGYTDLSVFEPRL